MPRYLDVRHTVLIVVGYGILPEIEDRPLAYELKTAIDSRGTGDRQRGAVVVTDVELPVVYMRDQHVFVQVDGRSKRAAIWGMDQRGTRDAVDLFVKDGFLDRFLESLWRRAGG